jgi:hypothetical protein
MVSEVSQPVGPTPDRRRRWKRWVVVFGLLSLVGATVLLWGWVQWSAARKLEREVALADRLDPGWRLADLMAARRPVPAATNSASQVLHAEKALPDGWPDAKEPPFEPPAPKPGENRDLAGEPPADPADPAEPLLTGTDLEDALRKTPPNVALSPDVKRAVDRTLKPVEKALPAARSLAGAGEGRYDFSLGEVAIAQLVPHIERARRVSRLLYLDAVRLAEEGKIDEALSSARALMGVARSVGDEPVDLSQIFRLHRRQSALSAIFRSLGQGDASDAVLAAVQDDLAREAEHDSLLCAMRAQRAAFFDTLGKMADGAYARYAAGDFGPLAGKNDRARPDPIAEVLYMRAYGRYNQALALSLHNHAVEGAKYRPFDPRWAEHWKVYEEGVESPGPIQRRLGALVYTVFPVNGSTFWMSYDSQALFAATRVLLAAERYRRAVGHWPEKLADMVPKYLRDVPRGPYSDQPIRYVRTDDGVVAYAVGMQGEDNGGRLHPERKRKSKYDVGERLWNPELRRRPATVAPTTR